MQFPERILTCNDAQHHNWTPFTYHDYIWWIEMLLFSLLKSVNFSFSVSILTFSQSEYKITTFYICNLSTGSQCNMCMIHRGKRVENSIFKMGNDLTGLIFGLIWAILTCSFTLSGTWKWFLFWIGPSNSLQFKARRKKPLSAWIALRLKHPSEFEGEDQIIRRLETFLWAHFY